MTERVEIDSLIVGAGVASMHDALQAQHRLDQRLPWCAREPGFGVKNFKSARLVAISTGSYPVQGGRPPRTG